MALWGDWMAKNGISRMLEAARRSDDLVALAQRLGNEEYVLQAHHSRWTNFYMMGDARISRADTAVMALRCATDCSLDTRGMAQPLYMMGNIYLYDTHHLLGRKEFSGARHSLTKATNAFKAAGFWRRLG